MGNERTRMWRVPFCREGSRHAQGLCPCRAAASCSSDFRCILASLSMLLAASPCSQLFPASLQSCQEWIARTIFHVWMFGDASVCQSASPWPLLPHLFFLAHHTVSTSTVLGPVSHSPQGLHSDPLTAFHSGGLFLGLPPTAFSGSSPFGLFPLCFTSVSSLVHLPFAPSLHQV